MTRFYLTYAVLFMIPFVLYGAFIYFSLGRAAVRESLTTKALGYLSVTGAALTVIIIVVLTNYSGYDADGTYTPAHLEDGKIVPGRIEPAVGDAAE
ncbi:MAG: hypothetical protein COA52_03970 [Hyphomicrobiales bacterium]|nr:MAG: hypothetical protein COA52_03970 [Hyphomicrobiales bacterium]